MNYMSKCCLQFHVSQIKWTVNWLYQWISKVKKNLNKCLWPATKWINNMGRYHIVYCIIRFTSFHCARTFHLLVFLAEAFRCHVHHFQCLTVPVEQTGCGKVYFPVHGCWDSRDVDVFDCVKECMRFVMYLII